MPNKNSPSQQQDERCSSPCREINRWCQSLGQGISGWRAEHLRRRQQQQSKRRFKICCCGITTAAIFFFIFIPIFVSLVQSPTDYCIRAGSETWALLPETITYKEGAVHIHINGAVSGGTIKLQPVPAGQEGIIHTRINVAPGSLTEKMSYSLYHTGQETQLTINVLDNASTIFGACVYVDMTITVPRDTRSVFVSASDVEIIANEEIEASFLELRTSNRHIKLEGGWHGDKIVLRTRNAALDFRNGNSLHAINLIDLETSNGAIYLDDSDSDTGSIHLSTTNGRIETRNTRAATLFDVNTSNGRVYLTDITATHMVVRTTNGKIELDRISVRDTLTVATRNGAIRAIVDESNHVKATFQSSNGKIRVNMPKDFIGPFRVTSSSAAKVAVRGSDVTYEIDKGSEKIGYRYSKYGEGSVDIHTSNARAMLLFI
ncbi:hypothetical protein BDC45DRAFT_22061 [Circinella umbellata]|nr:hypothetical protein BDC45DRAFT_22061 [Circinella umbellata]